MIPAILEQPPRVWVFDPNDPSHNIIYSEVIAAPADIDRVTEIVTSKVHKRPPGVRNALPLGAGSAVAKRPLKANQL